MAEQWAKNYRVPPKGDWIAQLIPRNERRKKGIQQVQGHNEQYLGFFIINLSLCDVVT